MTWQWLTTVPSGRAHTCEADDGRTGWKLHAIEADDSQTVASVRWNRAACGLAASNGWGLDLYIPDTRDYRCKRCRKVLGDWCPTCRGTGYVARADGVYVGCSVCHGKGAP